uniref:Uncharacterized protein n=1 Tax=Graphocephala atropunctata TaxID=36148 RepID=A0A1B6MMM5_9HEMI
MFDSSFCWFLFIAMSAVLVSNLAFMAAENALDWNMEMNAESPSFLRDLPITQKPQLQDNLPWAENEEVTVDTLEDLSASEQAEGKAGRHLDDLMDDKIKYTGDSNAVWPKQPLKIDSHEVGRYFKVLSDITGSAEAQNKFAQALLILDALHIGLKDLEEVVTENSELHKVLEKQKDTLFNALSEVELGVSRSMEKLATSVLNKVQKLERKFENQWCSLEKTGYKEELKGLFYNCQDNDEKAFETNSKTAKRLDKTKGDFSGKNNRQSNQKNDRHFNDMKDGHFDEKNARYFKEKNNKNSNKKNDQYFNEKNDKYFKDKNEKHKQTILNSYQYEVDKDSAGKVYTRSIVEDQGNDDYYKLLYSGNYNDNKHKPKKVPSAEEEKIAFKHKNDDYYNKLLESGRYNDNKHLNIQKHEKMMPSADYKEKSAFKDKNNDSEGKFYKGKDIDPNNGKGKYFKEMNQNHEKTKKESIKNKDKPYETKNEKPTIDQSKIEVPQSKHDKDFADKAAIEIVTRYLKENCEKNLNKEKSSYENDYQSLINGIRGNVKIPPDMFSKLYNKFCKTRGNNFKQNIPTSDFNKFQHDVPEAKQDKFKVDKLVIEMITKYLKENCKKIQNSDKTDNVYDTLKDVINEKVKIPPEIFHKMYERYCKFNTDGFKWDKDMKNDQAKGDFAGQNKERHFKGAPSVIEDPKQYVKNVIEIRLMEDSKEKGQEERNDLLKEKVILPTDKPRQWTFAYKSPPPTNKTNLSGAWYIKSGESRSKTRWAHHRGDWWFDRAIHRRGSPHPPSWFAGRRKNWFFRRAWARQQCRENPADSWCHVAVDETVTIPKTSSNLR